DGYVCVLVYNDKQWRAFFELIGRPELLADPRFATQEARSRDFESAYRLVAAEMAQRTTSACTPSRTLSKTPTSRRSATSARSSIRAKGKSSRWRFRRSGPNRSPNIAG